MSAAASEARKRTSVLLKEYQQSRSEKVARIIRLGSLGALQEDECLAAHMSSVTVPWSVRWSGEAPMEVRPCRWTGGRMALCLPHRPGSGKPVFSGKHLVRDRRSVAEHLCTVCGAAVDRKGVQWIDIAGGASPDGQCYTLSQTPFHFGCIAEAIQSCPWVGTGMTKFAPYTGPFDVAAEVRSGAYIKDTYGVNAHADARIIVGMGLQIPLADFHKLERIAV